jgi:hypothetical protein
MARLPRRPPAQIAPRPQARPSRIAEAGVDAPGRVTVVAYDGLKFALDCGIVVWDFCETMTLQWLIADSSMPAQKQQLRE